MVLEISSLVGQRRSRKGAGGSGRWAVCTSAAAGGELSTTNGRSPHLGGRGRPARLMPNEQSPQEVRASGKNSSRQSPRPVQKAPPLSRKGCASAQKLSSANGPARAWCIYVHQLGTLHSPIPPENSLNPSRHPVTRGVMGAGSPQPGQRGVTGSGPCARDGRCKHPHAVARWALTSGPQKCERKRRAHVVKASKLSGRPKCVGGNVPRWLDGPKSWPWDPRRRAAGWPPQGGLVPEKKFEINL